MPGGATSSACTRLQMQKGGQARCLFAVYTASWSPSCEHYHPALLDETPRIEQGGDPVLCPRERPTSAGLTSSCCCSFAPLFETQRFNNTLYTRWLRLQKEAPATQAARGRRSTSRLSQTLRPEDSRQASAGGDSTLSTSSNGSSRSRSMELTMEKVRR